MGTRFSAKTGYLMKQVVQGGARLDCLKGALSAMGRTSADLQGICRLSA